MSARTTPSQKTIEFVDGLHGKIPDEELAVIKRYMETRSREAAQVTVTPVDTAQYCSPRPFNPEIPSDVHEKMEEKDEGRMNSEREGLEPPSAGTGFETPGQQCHPIWETGRTTADGFLTAGVGSNQGGDNSSPTERVDTRAGTKSKTTSAAFNTVFPWTRHKLRDKKTFSKENKRFDSGGEGGVHPPPWNAAVMVVFSFLRGALGLGCPLFVICVIFLSGLFFIHCSFQVITFQRYEKHERRRRSSC